MNCPGSVALAERNPGKSSFAAAEGTFAHDIAAQCAKDPASTFPEQFLGDVAVVDGHMVECDKEMLDGVHLYLDTISRLRMIEEWVEVPLIEVLSKWDPDLGGTGDYATYDPNQQLLRVIDFKYGKGVYVEVKDNRQLKTYALGLMIAVNKPVKTVEVYIVQPRYEGAEPVRMESFPAWELMEFAGDIAEAARATRLPDAPLVAGPWCSKTFCPNVRVCPELERRQHALVRAEFSELKPYDPATLKDMLDAIPLVKERLKAIEEFAYKEACAGKKIPGYKLVDKVPRRKWTDEAAVIEWAKGRAIDPFEEPALKSPAQLEKGLKKAEKAELAQFCSAVSSGSVLVPESDKRPEITKMATVDDFPTLLP